MEKEILENIDMNYYEDIFRDLFSSNKNKFLKVYLAIKYKLKLGHYGRIRGKYVKDKR